MGTRHSSRGAGRGLSGPEINQDRLLAMFGYNCRRAYLLMRESFLKGMAPYHLKPTEFMAMVLMDSNPTASQKHLAQTLGLKPSNFATMVNRLEARRLLIRRADRPDKRFHSLELTKAGQRLMKKAERTLAGIEREATASLSVSERAVLVRMLQRVFLGKSSIVGSTLSARCRLAA